jgi:hypothetical protein
MRIPSRVLVTAAVLAAFPFGWGLGVFVAYLVAAKNFGQLPALTVPLCIIAAIVFALGRFAQSGHTPHDYAAETLVFLLLGWLL